MSHPLLIPQRQSDSRILQTVGGESRRTTGFTLIELLVVIAIIALLAVLLFSVAGSMKDASDRVGCVSNLRAIGVGLALYSADNDGWNPDGLNQSTVWTTLLQPYMSWTVYNIYSPPNASRYCPATSLHGVGDFKRNATTWNTDFGVNMRVLVYNDPQWGYRPTKRSMVDSEVIAVFDGYNIGTTDVVAARHRHRNPERTPDRDYANFLFMGGHVKTMTVTEMPVATDAQWGPPTQKYQ